ncbi:membrane cofactor protein-like isoform X2 [Hypanus sabinus]|uniref:membrane cofactor protein-like isoform X2 n=1 Tax=Hypanus sabinus TaxID=79690 RepID=UPI0028C4B7F8|nr:membrane cofactor protein-like isoform X2 [Hypanus sabinus]
MDLTSMITQSLQRKHWECSKPPKLENGMLEDRYRGTESFASGSRVSYLCNPGYTFSQNDRRSITCNEGVWEPLQATCTPKSCGSPGDIMNGYYQGDNTFGSKITFYCNEGYMMVGRNYRLCEVDGWSGQVPTCEVVKCPDIPAIENGEISRLSTDSWEYGMVAKVSCHGDYSLIGERKLICESDGNWNHPFPKCKDVKCLAPDVPNNVYMTSIYKPTYKYQEQISFRCEEGYVMKGDGHIVCGEDSNFSRPPPTCTQRVKCPLPDIPDNVELVSTRNLTYNYKEQISFQCKEGYELNGNNVIVCGEDGNFSPPPPTCTKPPESIPLYQKILYGVLAVVVVIIILLVIGCLYKRYSSGGSGSVFPCLTKNKKGDPESGEAHSNQMKPLAAAEGAK